MALTIAGSDSGGGAGIVADLLTFAAHQVFGAVAVAAVTAQNTRRVGRIQPVAAELLSAQIDAVFEDLRPDAVKIGMLGNAANVAAAAKSLKHWKAKNVVLDPVLVSKTGVRLLPPAAITALKKMLIPLATLVTPNLPEAVVLAGFPIQEEADRRLAAGVISDLGARAVLIKGGHGQGHIVNDLFFDGNHFIEFQNFRIETRATHGTGCTLSSAIAAHLARGAPLADAVKKSIEYLRQCLKRGLFPGEGHGCPGHF